MPIILPTCPDNFKLNKKNCRCKRVEKTHRIKTKTKKCPKGTRKNKKSGECENNVTVLADKTPKILKDLRKIINTEGQKEMPRAPHSFSPKVNQVIASLKSISPNRDMGLALCDDDKLWINKNGRGKCYGLKSKIAQTYMINNLLSKRPIVCNSIIAPKQNLANCWFNAFFMTFFISDKGRKFFRYLRLAMITGKLPNNTPIDSKLRMPFLLLNKYIEASLIGEGATYNAPLAKSLATLMDTNEIIKKISRALGPHRKKLGIVKVHEAGNPLDFYKGIISYLKSDSLSFRVFDVPKTESTKIVIKGKELYPYIKEGLSVVDFFVLQRWSEDAPEQVWNIPKTFKIVDKGAVYTYKLDSAVLRDTKKKHFSAYITCNGKPFGFDGESFSRMIQFDWKKKMNKDTQWRFAEQHNTYFNFRNGYYMLFYYRV